MNRKVGLFFYVDGKYYVSQCEFEKGEKYGDYIVQDKSHFGIWEKYLQNKYKVDFDYYPRGRFVYDTVNSKYIVYTDKCILDDIRRRSGKYKNVSVDIELDEHYKCSRCNLEYYV